VQISQLKQYIDIESILHTYPLQQIKKVGDEVKFQCPFHDDTIASCTFNCAKKVYYCFGCGVRGDILDFIMQMDNTSFTQAVNKLADIAGVTVEAGSSLAKDEQETIKWLYSMRKNTKIEPEVSAGVKEFIQKAMANKDRIRGTEFWQNRNFSSEVLDFFELGWYNERIVIPLRNTNGNYVGYSTRSSLEKSDDRFLHQKDIVKGSLLYNFNTVSKLLDDGLCDMIMLVEGFSDTWRAFQHGFLKCVAIMGSNVSKGQIDIILRHTYKVCLAFDNDDTGAGYKGMDDFYKKTHNLIEIEWMKIPRGKDVGSLSRDEFWTCFNNRVAV